MRLGLGLQFAAGILAAAAPALSSPMASSTVIQQAALQVTTDKAGGTLYAVVTKTSTPPTPSQVIAGLNASGAAAAYAGNQVVSAAGAQNMTATGLTQAVSTTYWAHFVHVIGGERSTVATTAEFAVEIIANGAFAVSGSWLEVNSALTISGGQGSFVAAANFGGIYQAPGTIPSGSMLDVTYELISVSGGATQIVGKSAADGGGGSTGFTLGNHSSPGVYSSTVTLTASAQSITARNTVNGTTSVIDNVSVKRHVA